MPCRRARQTERGRDQVRRLYRRPARAPVWCRALQCVLRTRVRVIVRAPQWFLLARAVIARSGAGMMRGKRTSQCGDTLYEAQGKTHIVVPACGPCLEIPRDWRARKIQGMTARVEHRLDNIRI